MAENSLLEKVLSLQDKYKKLEEQLADPEVIADMKKINPEYFNMDQVAEQMANDMTLPMIRSTLLNSTSRAVANKAAREAQARRISGGGGHTSWGGGGGGFSGGGFGGGVR